MRWVDWLFEWLAKAELSSPEGAVSSGLTSKLVNCGSGIEGCSVELRHELWALWPLWEFCGSK